MRSTYTTTPPRIMATWSPIRMASSRSWEINTMVRRLSPRGSAAHPASRCGSAGQGRRTPPSISRISAISSARAARSADASRRTAHPDKEFAHCSRLTCFSASSARSWRSAFAHPGQFQAECGIIDHRHMRHQSKGPKHHADFYAAAPHAVPDRKSQRYLRRQSAPGRGSVLSGD